MKEVWLIRHGESEANAGLVTSMPDLISLTEEGHRQAAKVSALIPAVPSLIVFSPYLRTQQTARPTLERFPQVERQEWNIQEFSFLSPALCKNTSRMERRPLVEEYWQRCDPFYIHGEGAESFADLYHRVCAMYRRIEQIEDGLVLIFGHGQFTRMFLLSLLLRPREVTPQLMQEFIWFDKVFEIPNGGIFKVRFYGREPFISGLISDHLQD
ncbi:MAG: histidine phosphatase family protein [Anaerolineales bacterium]|nr:histidine phosphatase family protein [Anaerolineales bacterium]